MKKHYAWVLAVLGLAIGIVSLYIALNEEQPLTSEQQELLNEIPPKVGWHCRPTEVNPRPDAPEQVSLIEALAKCEPVDPGPEEVTFASFTTEADLRNYMQLQRERLAGEGFPCEADFFSWGPWADASGRRRGELLCADGSDTAVLYWSDTGSRLMGRAISRLKNEDELHRWWQQSVKFDGGGVPQGARRRLSSLLPPEFGHCEQDDVLPPAAVAAVDCFPGRGITFAGAALFSAKTPLHTHMKTLADGYPGATSEGCDASTYSYSTWGAGSDEDLGKLLCYVTEGVQWFVWTTDRSKVYAFAAREDENLVRLFDEWSQRFSYIGRSH